MLPQGGREPLPELPGGARGAGPFGAAGLSGALALRAPAARERLPGVREGRRRQPHQLDNAVVSCDTLGHLGRGLPLGLRGPSGADGAARRRRRSAWCTCSCATTRALCQDVPPRAAVASLAAGCCTAGASAARCPDSLPAGGEVAATRASSCSTRSASCAARCVSAGVALAKPKPTAPRLLQQARLRCFCLLRALGHLQHSGMRVNAAAACEPQLQGAPAATAVACARQTPAFRPPSGAAVARARVFRSADSCSRTC